MFQTNKEIVITIVAGTVLLLIFCIVIVFAVMKYQNRQRRHALELRELQNKYQSEILKATLEVKEQTMNTISQELHDNIGQVLSLVKLNLSTILLDKVDLNDDKITESKNLVGQVIQDLRNLSKTLNTQYILQRDLKQSLTEELNHLKKSGQFDTTISVKGTPYEIDEQKQLILFRIAQESINNAVKHSEASEIAIVLNYQTNFISLNILDNGKGFNANAKNTNKTPIRGTGILNIYSRAEMIGAKVKIDSKIKKGTSITVVLPTKSGKLT